MHYVNEGPHKDTSTKSCVCVCACLSAMCLLRHDVTPRSVPFICSNISFAHAAISCRDISCAVIFF